jgi:signal transduction histidine kinase
MRLTSVWKPRFWDHHDAAAGPGSSHFSFRRKWLLIVTFTTLVTLTPLVVMTLVDYRLTRQAFETEATMAISRVVSNTQRSISFLLSQRRSALAFIARDNSMADLMLPDRLTAILDHLRKVMDGFVDLGVVDANRRMQAYAGPDSGGREQPIPGTCFDQAVANGFFISDVTANQGQDHQLVMAIRHDMADGRFWVLRSSLDAGLFDLPVSQLAVTDSDDAFIINRQGILQTPSRNYGRRFEAVGLTIPMDAGTTRVLPTVDRNGLPVLVGIAPIADSPFLLMMVRQQSGIMDLWFKPRMRLIGFLLFSIILILASIVGVATYLVNRIHAADQRRVQALHQVEYANKLASIGRLASGVAHEVNNPLAIINQKTGLIKDLTGMADTGGDPRIMALLDDVLASVKRCGAITRRLLDFARHMESSVEVVDIEAVIHQVLAFMEKEAQRRRITVSVRTRGRIPRFESDRGKLQQVFLNLINNAFAAMQAGGRLTVTIQSIKRSTIQITVADTGHGIPQADLKRVFEPFFSTRQGHAGTGLGLSVTYGLVSEMGGDITVASQVGQGTRFTISLPLRPPGTAAEPQASTQETICGDADALPEGRTS